METVSGDEQRVRTMAGWIGVEISRSRVRTAGKAGFGLYRVRGSKRADPLDFGEVRELDGSEVPDIRTYVPTGWTAYGFTLGEIERAVDGAIRRGAPACPGLLRLPNDGGRGGWPVERHFVTVQTRWTSAYRGKRNLGERAEVTSVAVGGLGEGFEVPCQAEREPGGERCTGTVGFAPGDVQGRCDTCGTWAGRQAPSTVRSRQRAANAEFQTEHLRRRAYGLEQRYAAKRARNGREVPGGPPSVPVAGENPPMVGQ